jgi:hypothetical protein
MTQAHVRKLIALEQIRSVNDCVISKNSAKVSTNEGTNTYLQKDIPIQMTGAVVNQGMDFTITLTDQNMDFTEFQKSYITLHLTMDLIFEDGFPLTAFTTQKEPPQAWSSKCLILVNNKVVKPITNYFGMKFQFYVNLRNSSTCFLDLNMQLIVFNN